MGCVSSSAYRIAGVSSAEALRGSGIVSASANRTDGITASAYLMCDVGHGNYLRVIPAETQWVDVSMFATYDIRTKEEWSLE